MTRDDFWQIVAQLIAKTRGNLERFTTDLDKHLKSLTTDEIEDFARHYADLRASAHIGIAGKNREIALLRYVC
jgi:hypothetical protein